jgi:hypothetical protein
VVNETVEWVSVRKGQVMGDMVEVFGNLKEGDSVAKAASEELLNQSQVTPVKTSAEPDKASSAAAVN